MQLLKCQRIKLQNIMSIDLEVLITMGSEAVQEELLGFHVVTWCIRLVTDKSCQHKYLEFMSGKPEFSNFSSQVDSLECKLS